MKSLLSKVGFLSSLIFITSASFGMQTGPGLLTLIPFTRTIFVLACLHVCYACKSMGVCGMCMCMQRLGQDAESLSLSLSLLCFLEITCEARSSPFLFGWLATTFLHSAMLGLQAHSSAQRVTWVLRTKTENPMAVEQLFLHTESSP